MQRSHIFLLLFLLLFKLGFSQQHPPSVKWRAINTEHFEVVFPQEIEKEAQRVANELERFYLPAAASLDTVPKKISIFLGNRTTISNGYVRLFPRMSMWYTTPSQQGNRLGNDDWLRSMGIHEYRHMVQFDKANQKFTKFFSRLFGDLVRTGLAWSVPMWFIEGDAVVIETALTQEGRGRIPNFGMPIRASLLEGRKLSYEQAYLGSYRKYFPDHYKLGYYMTAYGRRKYGAKLWSKATDKYSGYSFWPFAFSHATRRLTNENFRTMYRSTMSELDSLWRAKLIEGVATDFETIPVKRKVYTSYTYPQAIGHGKFLATKNGLGHYQNLVEIGSDGKERFVKKLASTHFSYANGKIVWAELYSDLRWTERDFSNLKLYDLNKKQTRKLTRKGKFFAPALSPDATKIVAVEHTDSLNVGLVVFDAESGDLQKKKTIGNNEMIRNPRWDENGERIVFTHSKFSGAALSVWNTKTDEVRELKPHTWEVIGEPMFAGRYVLYNSAYNGNDAIYAIDAESKAEWLVAAGKYGAFNASKSDSLLVFQNYSADGHRVAYMPFDPQKWTPKKDVEQIGIQYYKPLVKQEGGSVFSQPIDTVEYKTQKYNWYRGLVNFHSLFLSPNELPTVALSALSRNKLNTLDLEAGFKYDNNEQRFRYFGSATFKGLYPLLSVSGEYGKRDTYYQDNEENLYHLFFHQTDLYATVQFPFHFSNGIYSRYASVYTSYQRSIIRDDNNRPYRVPALDRNILNHGATFQIVQQPNSKDVTYRLAFFSSVNYKYQFDEGATSKMFAARNTVFLPSVFRHHSIRLEAVNERKTDGEYAFRSSNVFTRGYNYSQYSQGESYDRFSADYTFPLLYPDLRIGSLLYINRLRGNLFYDNSRFDNYQLDSFGGELFADFYVFQIKFPFSVGVRYSQRLYDNSYKIEGIFAGINMSFY